VAVAVAQATGHRALIGIGGLGLALALPLLVQQLGNGAVRLIDQALLYVLLALAMIGVMLLRPHGLWARPGTSLARQ
jgi:hypothetical protein